MVLAACTNIDYCLTLCPRRNKIYIQLRSLLAKALSANKMACEMTGEMMEATGLYYFRPFWSNVKRSGMNMAIWGSNSLPACNRCLSGFDDTD